MNRLLLVALSAVTFLGTAASASAAIDRAWLEEHALEAVPERWLVVVHEDARDGVLTVVQAAGGRLVHESDLVPGLLAFADLSETHAERIDAMRGVVRVLPDYRVEASMPESAPLVEATPSQKSAAGVGDVDGAGTRVCIVDTGVRSTHVVFEGRVAAGYDFANDDDDPSDDNGHGTHVAGTAAGGDSFLVGGDPWQGIAHEATIVPVKVLSSSGGGTASAIIAGIDFCAADTANNPQADVINLSLGGGLFSSACDHDPIAQAANAASDAGVVVVAATGNDCVDGAVSTPACGSKVIAVGASWDTAASGPRFGCYRGTCSDRNAQVDHVHCFSNGGPQIDVVAPGGPTTSASNASDDATATYYGTSQATPHVAGLAALLIDQDATRTPAEVRQLIRDGAIDIEEPGWDGRSGEGRIDVVASLSGPSACGDGTCDPGEDRCGCPSDCGTPPGTETNCSDGLDEDCDGLTDCDDFDCSTSSDCSATCGDGVCDPDETGCSCPQDCGITPDTESDCSNGLDDDCDGAIDGDDSDCSGDAVCGDGICEGGTEDCTTCPADCESKRRGQSCCGDGVCQPGENANNCFIDCAA